MLNRSLLLLPLALLASCSQHETPAASPTSTSAPSFNEFKKSPQELAAVVSAQLPGNNCNEDCSDLRQEMRYLLYVAQKIYPYWEEKKKETGYDYEALSKELENSIDNNTSLSEYYSLIRRWAGAFRDGHVNGMAAGNLPKLEIYSSKVRLGILAHGTENEKVIVVSNKATNLPIAVGDEIIEADGLSIKDALDKADKECSGSTKRMRRICAVYRITDSLGLKNAKPLLLKYKHGETVNSVSVPRKISLVTDPPAEAPATADDTSGASAISASLLDSDIGYLKIDQFSGTQMKALMNLAMDRMQDTKALIIDMRENGGGDQSGNVILSRLTDKTITRYKTSFRSSDFLLAMRPSQYFFGFDPSKPFTDWAPSSVPAAAEGKRYLNKPVVVLTSSYCFSACDTFTSAMKANGLATIIGEPTGGGTGSPLIIELPASGFSFRYSVIKGITAKDEPIEGVGTEPDIYKAATVSDLLGSTDTQMDEAIRFVKEKMTGQPFTGELPQLSIRERNYDLSPTVADELRMSRLAPWDEKLED